MPSPLSIRPVTAADAEAVADIYSWYVVNTTVTFEEAPVNAVEMGRRIRAAALPWLVGCRDGDLLAYACASPWRTRSAYRFSAESSIYVRRDAVGSGIGTQLYGALLGDLRRLGIATLIGGITLPNDPSIALHEKLGFVPVGVFRRVGWKFGAWRDVGYWQLHMAGGSGRSR